MDSARLASEVERLKRRILAHPELCEEAHCKGVTTTETVVHPDGTIERLGKAPPAPCGPCPYRGGGGPIRHVEIVRRYTG